MVITAKQLEDLKACKNELALFTIHFGECAEVALENCLEAAELGLNIDWLAKQVLSDEARVEYEKAIVSAWAKYDEATAIAFYDAVKGESDG